MKIIPAQATDKKIWNSFVRDQYPPIGAFMQTWEWGDFKKDWGKKINRFLVKENNELIAIFMLAEHNLPFGFKYGYIPRGPVISTKFLVTQKINSIFETIRNWAKKEYSELIFLRLEPPLADESLTINLSSKKFVRPKYYIQPRFNLAINLTKTEDEILSSFHPSTRSNLNRAERRGVSVQLKEHNLKDDQENFWLMAKDTISRNSGKNLYPPHSYFASMFKILSPFRNNASPRELFLGTFCGYQNDKPAAMHYVLFFGDTATYLYGASATDCLRSKVTTYLHWQAMREAKKRGFKYYDLGGIDEKLWPSITTFKRQFGGQEFSYLGLIDLPLKPFWYRLYNLTKKLSRFH